MENLDTTNETSNDLTLGQEIGKEVLTAVALTAATVTIYLAGVAALGAVVQIRRKRAAKKNQQQND